MGSKSEMLAGIRAALGGGSEGGARRAQSRSPVATIPGATRQELVNQFCAELEKVGGHVIPIQSDEQIRDYIEELLPELEITLAGPTRGADDLAPYAVGADAPGTHAIEAHAPGPHASNATGPPSIAVSDGAHRLQPGLRAWLASRGLALIPSLRESEMDAEGYKHALFASALGVTTADFAIADTGTLVLVSEHNPAPPSAGAPQDRGNGGDQHRLISLVPPIHVCLLDTNRILPNLAELIECADLKYYGGGPAPLAMTFITGPSRTADIELTLTMGVHGPRELHVLLYDSTLRD